MLVAPWRKDSLILRPTACFWAVIGGDLELTYGVGLGQNVPLYRTYQLLFGRPGGQAQLGVQGVETKFVLVC